MSDKRKKHSCSTCDRTFKRIGNCNLHQRHCTLREAFGGKVSEASFKEPKASRFDPTAALRKIKRGVFSSVRQFYRANGPLKFLLGVTILFHQIIGGTSIVADPGVTFHPKFPKVIFREESIDRNVEESLKSIEKQIEQYEGAGSGWVFKGIENVITNCVQYRPLSAGGTFIKTPNGLNKKCLINVRNFKNPADQHCFQYSILASLYRNLFSVPSRVTNYHRLPHHVKFEGLKTPMPISDLSKFEEMNPSIKVNLFGVDGTTVFPLRLAASSTKKQKTVDLLYIEKTGVGHFITITSLEGLVRKQSQGSKSNKTRVICRRCLSFSGSTRGLKNHMIGCGAKRMCVVELPSEDKKIMKFTAIEKMMPMAYWIVADFESILVKNDEKCGANSKNLNKHQPCGFGYVLQSSIPGFENKPVVTYRGEDAAQVFLEKLQHESRKIMKLVNHPKDIVMTETDEKKFNEADRCYACGSGFTVDDAKVRDHCNQGRIIQTRHAMLVTKETYKFALLWNTC